VLLLFGEAEFHGLLGRLAAFPIPNQSCSYTNTLHECGYQPTG